MSNTLWAIAKLGLLLSDQFIKDYEQRFFSQNPNAQDMSNTLWAMAKLGLLPSDQFMTELEQRFFSQNTNAQNMSNALWATVVLDVISGGKHKDFALSIIKSQQFETHIKSFNKKNLAQLIQAFLWLDYDISGLGNIPSETMSTSISENTLAGIFARACGTIDKGSMVTIPQLGHRVDIVPKTKTLGGKAIWVEVDGHDHFVSEGKGGMRFYDGGTLLMTALMLKFATGAMILRLPKTVGSHILSLTNGAQIQAAKNLVDSAKNLDPRKAHVALMRDGQPCIVPLEPHVSIT
jgi:hypothetical protein